VKHDFQLQDSGGDQQLGSDHPEERNAVSAKFERHSRKDEDRAHHGEQLERDASAPAHGTLAEYELPAPNASSA
jgi:hypothetical protein